MNPEGGGCGEPRSHHCTPAWVTRAKLHLRKKKKKKEKETNADRLSFKSCGIMAMSLLSCLMTKMKYVIMIHIPQLDRKGVTN